MRPSLSEVIEALLGSVVEDGGRRDPISGTALVVTEAEVDVPLESTFARDDEGRPILLASPPFGTMKTGFDRPAFHARIRLALEEDG